MENVAQETEKAISGAIKVDEKEIREDAESSLCLPNFYSNEELPSKNRNHNWLGVLFPR